MFSYDQIKKMYDWGNFTDEQVREFISYGITEEEAEKIINKES